MDNKNITQDMLPEKYRPLGMWAYFGYTILFSIPLLGFIFLIIYSFSDKNINRRNFARSYFCVFILMVIIYVICMILAVAGIITGGILGGGGGGGSFHIHARHLVLIHCRGQRRKGDNTGTEQSTSNSGMQ